MTTSHTDQARGIRIAPVGWTDLADAEAFYPDDLPADWRLTYFANVVGAVLLPPGQWADAAPLELAAWRDDVHERFRFFLEYTPDRVASLPAARGALGTALEALVAGPGGDDALRPCLSPDRPEGPAIGYAASPPAAARGNPRAARRWLEELAREHGAPPRLIVLDRPTMAELSAWQQLAVLLGLAS